MEYGGGGGRAHQVTGSRGGGPLFAVRHSRNCQSTPEKMRVVNIAHSSNVHVAGTPRFQYDICSNYATITFTQIERKIT